MARFTGVVSSRSVAFQLIPLVTMMHILAFLSSDDLLRPYPRGQRGGVAHDYPVLNQELHPYSPVADAGGALLEPGKQLVKADGGLHHRDIGDFHAPTPVVAANSGFS